MREPPKQLPRPDHFTKPADAAVEKSLEERIAECIAVHPDLIDLGRRLKREQIAAFKGWTAERDALIKKIRGELKGLQDGELKGTYERRCHELNAFDKDIVERTKRLQSEQRQALIRAGLSALSPDGNLKTNKLIFHLLNINHL